MNTGINRVRDIKYKFLLVLGNGFDLDMELKTKFSDFAHSNEWENMVKRQAATSRPASLLQYLDWKKDKENWFDIERELLNFATDKEKANNAAEDEQGFKVLCDALNEYLRNMLSRTKTPIKEVWDKLADNLQQAYHNCNDKGPIYTFNYTPTIQALENLPTSQGGYIDKVFVHGRVAQDTLTTSVLGIETNNYEEIAPGYSFLYKSNNKNFRSTNLPEDLIASREVIIFGHSMNMIDSVYFKEYFKVFEESKEFPPKLTLITKNEESAKAIRDNLRAQGLSLPLLLKPERIEIIKSDSFYNNEEEDTKAFGNLIQRLGSV